MLFLLLLWSVAWLSKEALSFPNYLDHIPNGHSLRIKNNLILGIGHSNPGGGGSLNSFGKDFFAHEKTWTQQLCELDSDGDGKTNGEELGDPDCVWKRGSVDLGTSAVALSHPGVNELFEDYQTNLSGILLSFWAGSSTGFGAIFAVVFMDYCSKREPRGIHAALAFSLSLAAGVMVTVSLVDLWYPLVIKFGFFIPSLCTALGFLFFHLLQLGLKTHCEAPSGNLSPLPLSAKAGVSSSLKDRNMKLAITMFFTLTLHNFPEGLAVQVSNLSSESLGFTMAIAIAFHNFPEGIAIACPYYAATGHRGRAIGLAFLSGMSEPMGAGFSVLVLQSFFRENVNLISYALCVVGGIMLSSSLFELLPESVSHGRNDLVVVGFVIGSLIMLFTIWAIE